MNTPQLPPLIIKKSPSAFYVYTYKNKWDPEKKRSYRASFKKVGTVTRVWQNLVNKKLSTL